MQSKSARKFEVVSHNGRGATRKREEKEKKGETEQRKRMEIANNMSDRV